MNSTGSPMSVEPETVVSAAEPVVSLMVGKFATAL